MIDFRALNKAQFQSAKRYWALATILKVSIFATGLLGVFSDAILKSVPLIILGLAISSELVQVWSDEIKSRGEALLRILDMCDSFGRQISESDKRDIIAATSRSSRKRHSSTKPDDGYFGSLSDVGPRRAIQNLSESAWYSGQLSRLMAFVYLSGIVILFVTSIVALFVALKVELPATSGDQLVKVVTGWLMLLVSLNMSKYIFAYTKMYLRCEKTRAACMRLDVAEVSDSDAMRQWQEYHISRNAAPLIPQWLWRLNSDSLNEAWLLAKESPESRVRD